MKRKLFLTFASAVALLYGIIMIAMPDSMLASMLTAPSAVGSLFLQIIGVSLIAVGVLNFAARTDNGSPSLRGVMFCNIIMHLTWVMDIMGATKGLINSASIVPGLVVHAVFLFGFVYYLAKLPKQQGAA